MMSKMLLCYELVTDAFVFGVQGTAMMFALDKAGQPVHSQLCRLFCPASMARVIYASVASFVCVQSCIRPTHMAEIGSYFIQNR